MKPLQLSELMKISWEMQTNSQYNRSKALMAAWAILKNERVIVYHLVRRHSHTSYPNRVNPDLLTLFPAGKS